MEPDTILEHIQTPVLLLDQKLRIGWVNQAFETTFGVSIRQILDTDITRFIGADHDLVSSLHKALRQQQTLLQHHSELSLNGSAPITGHCLITPVEEGPAWELLIEFHPDYANESLLHEEEVLARQQANQMMLRGLAHEIKNPLGGIRGAAQLLMDETGNTEERTEFIQIIVNETDRLTNLVNRMLSPSLAPKRKTTNIHEIIERVLTLTTKKLPAGIQLQRDYDPSIPPIFSDEEQLIQIVLNLVRNALQALEEGQDNRGTVLLRTRITGRMTIGLKRHRQLVQIEIIDDGPGIPDQLQKQIFLPMVSGRAGGSGLGLSLAQSLATTLGGLIKFKSKPRGYEFHTVITY